MNDLIVRPVMQPNARWALWWESQAWFTVFNLTTSELEEAYPHLIMDMHQCRHGMDFSGQHETDPLHRWRVCLLQLEALHPEKLDGAKAAGAEP